MKYKATVRVTFTVDFDDNGEDDHKTQALEATQLHTPAGLLQDAEIDIIAVEPDRTEAPDSDA